MEELKRRRWDEEKLGRRTKGDEGKLAMAVRLRAETAMTVKWIAERLQMGVPGYVNHPQKSVTNAYEPQKRPQIGSSAHFFVLHTNAPIRVFCVQCPKAPEKSFFRLTKAI